MMRCVAYRKAISAGVVGALAWEAVARSIMTFGVPLFDIVFMIGTMRGHEPAWIWWPAGMAMHAMVGAIWAIFYAYFFWSTLDRPPVIQGIVFSIIPAVLAGAVMIPQMGLMNLLVLSGQMIDPGIFAMGFGWGGPAGIFIGHAAYGASMGLLYTRPVGYPTGRKPKLAYE
jgi:hypothetical protein